MSACIQLIVGLGNPGKEHKDTRHNAGAWFIEKVAQDAHATLRLEPKYQGAYGTFMLPPHRCHLLVPHTFMNLSGQSVRACLNYQKLATKSLLVAHDDIDLPVGAIKLKYDGGDGGHNGLKDIIRHLHTKQFYRLRIGVGRPKKNEDVVKYVLGPPARSEREKIDLAIEQGQGILPLVLNGELQRAMQQLHTEQN